MQPLRRGGQQGDGHGAEVEAEGDTEPAGMLIRGYRRHAHEHDTTQHRAGGNQCRGESDFLVPEGNQPT